MTTNISIASDALTMIGAEGIQSFEDDSVEAMAVNAMYEPIYESLLTQYNWSFAKDVLQLNRLDKKADYGYKYVYRVDSTILKVINLNNIMSNDYKLRKGKEIHTNQEYAYVTAIVKVEEDELPSNFVLTLKYKLAAAFAPIIMENDSASQRWLALGQQQLRVAMLADAQQQPANYLKQSTLVTAARGGYGY